MQVTPPSSWIARHAHLIPKPGPVLDLAAGNGRHARYFKGLGYAVVAVDRDVSRLADLVGDAQITIIESRSGRRDDPGRWVKSDTPGSWVTNYLHRPLFRAIARALQPGGVLIYETFGTRQRTVREAEQSGFPAAAGRVAGVCRGGRTRGARLWLRRNHGATAGCRCSGSSLVGHERASPADLIRGSPPARDARGHTTALESDAATCPLRSARFCPIFLLKQK